MTEASRNLLAIEIYGGINGGNRFSIMRATRGNMAMSGQEPSEMRVAADADLIRKAEELQSFSAELRGKLDERKVEYEREKRKRKFYSRDPKDFWAMPRWLWVSVVLIMLSLFVAAFLRVQ
jgi:hypothetical protein